MHPMIAAFLGVALLAISYALPIGSFLGTGIALEPQNGLIRQYIPEMVIGRRPVKIGLSWAKDGTVAAGAHLVIPQEGNDIPLPISAAISSNINDLWKDIKYEVGTQVLGIITELASGDLKGNFRYLVNAWLPVWVNDDGQLGGFGFGMEGAQLNPVAFSGGVGVGSDVIGARVGLDSNLKPENINVNIRGLNSKL